MTSRDSKAHERTVKATFHEGQEENYLLSSKLFILEKKIVLSDCQLDQAGFYC